MARFEQIRENERVKEEKRDKARAEAKRRMGRK